MRMPVRLVCLVMTVAGTACASPPLEPFATTDNGYFQRGGVRLYYAFDLPEGVERPPLIVLSHGSGRVTTAANAKRALPLVQRGFAVFRFDKRGVGKSEGDYSKAFDHMTVLAGDLVAAVNFIKSDPRIDPSRIGLMGASQAGWVVPEAAVRSPEVSFVILLSGPTVTGQQANYWDQIADDESLTVAELEEIFRQFEPRSENGDVDPRQHLEQLQVPGLWVYGKEDRIVPAGPSAEILEGLVDTLGKRFSIRIFPGVGHSIEANYWPELFDWYDREVGGVIGRSVLCLAAAAAPLAAQAAPGAMAVGVRGGIEVHRGGWGRTHLGLQGWFPAGERLHVVPAVDLLDEFPDDPIGAWSGHAWRGYLTLRARPFERGWLPDIGYGLTAFYARANNAGRSLRVSSLDLTDTAVLAFAGPHCEHWRYA